MPVCIAGMARSGTSMSTRILNVCGLYLGEESDLLPPAPDNPDGFWENSRIVEINEELLSMLGGAWDCPPILPMEFDERFARVRAKAEVTLEMFADREPWGWKDPRNSLTLPFWRHYFPDMKVVICLRNPLEVAQSLYRRSWYSYELSVTLWYTYNQRLLNAIPREQRIITQYDTYFADPAVEIRRVLDFLGLPATDQRIVQACSAVSRGLRHHRFTRQQMLDVGVLPAVFDLYTAMSIEAGVMGEDVASGNADDPGGGMTRSFSINERDADDAARNRLVRQFPHAENVLVQTEKQPGLTHIGVGHLDRSAMDAMVLREEVHILRAAISDAHDAYGKLQEVARGTERSLLALAEAHEQRGAYVETLEQQGLARAARDEETRSYVEMLEQRLLALTEAHEQRGAYIETLEQQDSTRAASNEETRLYIRGLEEHIATVHAQEREIHAYTRALEQQISASKEEQQRLAASIHALENENA